MSRQRTRLGSAAWALAVAFALLAPVLVSPARAEEVMQEHAGLELVARLETPKEAPIARDGAVIILHDSLAHHGAAPIPLLQAALKGKGVATLAPTLSYGLNKRRGTFDCKLEQDHRSGDAVDEIAAWVNWLRESHGMKRVTVVGIGRAAAQVVEYARGGLDPEVAGVALVYPELYDHAETARRYEAAYGAPLDAILARARKLVSDGDDDKLLDAPGFITCTAPKVTASAFLDYYAPERMPPLETSLKSLKLPALVLAGPQAAPSEAGQRAALKQIPPLTLQDIPSAQDAASVDAVAAAIASLHAGAKK